MRPPRCRSRRSGRLPPAPRLRSATASATAIAPLPVPTSATEIGGVPGGRGDPARRRRTSASARSTRASVSGRGMSARSSTAYASPWNSLIPRMYATGSPTSRRASATSYWAAGSARTGTSGYATIAVRSTPTALPSSSSASSRGDSDPAARRRSTPARRSSATVAIAQSRMVTDTSPTLRRTSALVRAPPAMEQQVDRGIADADVRERHPGEPCSAGAAAAARARGDRRGPRGRASTGAGGTERPPPRPGVSRRPDRRPAPTWTRDRSHRRARAVGSPRSARRPRGARSPAGSPHRRIPGGAVRRRRSRCRAARPTLCGSRSG